VLILNLVTVAYFEAFFSRGIMGARRKVSAKHLPAYLDEMYFRFNTRKNRFLYAIRSSNSFCLPISNTRTAPLKRGMQMK
jgi:hypothetical protein